MATGMVRVALATGLYFAFHSALANDWTKAQAAGLFGQRWADAWYRPVYLVQGLVLLGVLAMYSSSSTFDAAAGKRRSASQASRAACILAARPTFASRCFARRASRFACHSSRVGLGSPAMRRRLSKERINAPSAGDYSKADLRPRYRSQTTYLVDRMLDFLKANPAVALLKEDHTKVK